MSRNQLVEDDAGRVSLSAGRRNGNGLSVRHEGRGLAVR